VLLGLEPIIIPAGLAGVELAIVPLVRGRVTTVTNLPSWNVFAGFRFFTHLTLFTLGRAVTSPHSVVRARLASLKANIARLGLIRTDPVTAQPVSMTTTWVVLTVRTHRLHILDRLGYVRAYGVDNATLVTDDLNGAIYDVHGSGRATV
jgi:hypothetical protein